MQSDEDNEFEALCEIVRAFHKWGDRPHMTLSAFISAWQMQNPGKSIAGVAAQLTGPNGYTIYKTICARFEPQEET
jgi:hypothetical protein